LVSCDPRAEQQIKEVLGEFQLLQR